MKQKVQGSSEKPEHQPVDHTIVLGDSPQLTPMSFFNQCVIMKPGFRDNFPF